ncbi:alpha-methylacyl racemase [Fusarium pseudocircinatum]|uniref:Alpha-methylacyl racemase n=1 Tax=Fusarium pseudocircinatum TaxID=56676 RepID=A0A8H5UVU2_9HYPO|nr:alpha-methylacyl racemase [Fusarium pseudocircinatum]
MESKPPLTGLQVVELAGLAPGPFCGQLLSSYGASVVRVDRAGVPENQDILTSYKSSILLDLKNRGSIRLLKALLDKADILIDPFRPGVLERLGLCPSSVLLVSNPRLIVVRITGFRRDGPYKDMAGHDINYLAVSGLLSMLGSSGLPPSPPGNLLADYAGGGLVAFAGVLMALYHRSSTGKGQVVDASMVDGASYIGTIPRLKSKEPAWRGERGNNLLDGGCPYYQCYECKDEAQYMSVGALEPQFFANLLRGLGLTSDEVLDPGLRREDKRSWPRMREAFANRFRERTRKEWEQIFNSMDACVAPVLEHKEMERAGYEHRPIVHLSASPARPVDSQWEGKRLSQGHGAEEVLETWLGWEQGRDYAVDQETRLFRVVNSKI